MKIEFFDTTNQRLPAKHFLEPFKNTRRYLRSFRVRNGVSTYCQYLRYWTPVTTVARRDHDKKKLQQYEVP